MYSLGLLEAGGPGVALCRASDDVVGLSVDGAVPVVGAVDPQGLLGAGLVLNDHLVVVHLLTLRAARRERSPLIRRMSSSWRRTLRLSDLSSAPKQAP